MDSDARADRLAATKAPKRKVSRDPMLAELRQRRVALGLTQQDVAERLGIGQRNISDLERGRSAPTLHTLRRWAAAVHCQIDVCPGPDWPLSDVDAVAVERVARGDQVPLTSAERQVAVAVLTALGMSSRLIGERLGISPRSVVRRRSSAVHSLGTEPVHRLSRELSTGDVADNDRQDAA